VAEQRGGGARRRVVIGIGNADRGDDAVGLLTARLLTARLPQGIAVIEHDGEATGLLAHLEGAETAYLIDAAVSGAPAGTVQRFDCSASPLPVGGLVMSTHGFGPAEAIELARALGQLPAECVVFAIEAAGVEAGAALSSVVRAAAEDVAQKIADELASVSTRPGDCAHA
jgi:hydrogenase maturation protease